MAARMGPLVLLRTPYAVSSRRNNFKIDRYLDFSTGQVSDQYSGGVLEYLGTCYRAGSIPAPLNPRISRAKLHIPSHITLV